MITKLWCRCYKNVSCQLAAAVEKGMEKKTLSVIEAATILGISRNKCYQGVANGEIPSIRIGRRIVVPAAALDRLLQEGQVHSASNF